MRRFGVLGVLLLALTTGGCDWMVGGEGHFEAALVGPGEPFASASIVVTGEGVLDVTGDRGTRVYSRVGDDGEIRAVVIQEASTGTLHFRIQVRDRSGSAPTVRVLHLADLDNTALAVSSSHRVLLGR